MPPDPAWRSLTHQDFRLGLSNCVTQPEQPEHSCRLQLLHSPITAEPYREKTRPLRPRRSWFAPAETHPKERVLVEAPGTAPGSEWFIATVIYFHSRRTGTPNIGCNFGGKKGRRHLNGRGNTAPDFRFDIARLRFRSEFDRSRGAAGPGLRPGAARIFASRPCGFAVLAARRSGVLQCSNRKGCDQWPLCRA